MSTRLTAALCLLLACAASAQTVYVDDRLQLGLHESPELTSTILELLPAGTSLEVLERSGDMARVQIADGRSGWVDARLLTEQPPGRARVRELETELAGAQAALADMEAKLVVATQNAAAATPERPAGEGAQAIPSDALREMQRLAEENQRLKQQVAELEAVQRMSLEQAAAAGVETDPESAPESAALPPEPALAQVGLWKTWHVLLLLSVLLLAFSVGGWLVDWGVRRRHGGFRV